MYQIPKVELTLKVIREGNYVPTIISTGSECAKVIRTLFNEETFHWTEEMLLLCLNNRNEIMHYCIVSTGGMCGTVCDVRKILLIALQSAATSIILSHNHPSGNLKPSAADLNLTSRVKEAASFHEIKLLDHVILTYDSYLSMMEEGLIY